LVFFSFFAVSSAYVNYFMFTSDQLQVNVYQDSYGYLTFQYSEMNNQTGVYTMALNQIWEATNSSISSIIPMSNFSLPKWRWDKGIGATIKNRRYYSLTAAPNPGHWDHMWINASFPLGPFNDSVAACQIDMNIDGYTWMSAQSSTKLVFDWAMTTTDNSGGSIGNMVPAHLKGGSKTVNYQGAYFSLRMSTHNHPSGVSLALSNATSPNGFVIMYDHFDSGNFQHEAQFGFGGGPGFDYLRLSIFIIILIVIMICICLIFFICFKICRMCCCRNRNKNNRSNSMNGDSVEPLL